MGARRIRTERVIAVLGAAVLVLGGLVLWRVASGDAVGPIGEAGSARLLRQAREQLGPRAEVRLLEAGAGRTLCGYVGLRGEAGAQGFVSRPNRLLLASDPLRDEFSALIKRDCPRFPQPPPYGPT